VQNKLETNTDITYILSMYLYTGTNGDTINTFAFRNICI